MPKSAHAAWRPPESRQIGGAGAGTIGALAAGMTQAPAATVSTLPGPEPVAAWPLAERRLLDELASAIPAGRQRLVESVALPSGEQLLAFERVATPSLTEREQAILSDACRGLANKEIAINQRISCSTASTTFRAAVRRLGFGEPLHFLCVVAGLRAAPGTRRALQQAGRVLVTFHDQALADAGQLLTKAEREVALQLLRGRSNGAIARARNTSPHTVANQLRAIYGKLGVGSRRELSARYGQPLGSAA